MKLAALAVFCGLTSAPAWWATQKYTVITGGKAVGHLNADVQPTRTSIDFDFKVN